MSRTSDTGTLRWAKDVVVTGTGSFPQSCCAGAAAAAGKTVKSVQGSSAGTGSRSGT